MSTAFECMSLLAKNFETTLQRYFAAELQNVDSWFDNVRDLTGIEQELRRQIASPLWRYRLHHPSPAYVLPFILAARGEVAEADELAIAGLTGELEPLLPDVRAALRKAAQAASLV